MGATVMADSQRNPDHGHAIGRPKHCGVDQHVLHVPHRTVFPVHLVRDEVGYFPLLRRLGVYHGSLRSAVCPGDQRHAHHVHGPRLEAALVLEEVYAPCD